MTMRCAILDDYQQVALSSADWSGLREQLDIAVFEEPIPPGEVAQRLAPFEIVVAMRERTVFDAATIERLPALKLLVTTGMVNASIDMDAARRQGVTVSGTRGSVGPAAELAWGLLLALMRNIPSEHANFHQGGERWQLSVGRDLMGKTLGVVGLGKLGKRVAGYGRAFDMKVLGWSKNNTAQRSAEIGVEYCATLDEMLARSDVVSLHLTLNDETRGIIGARELSLMKPGAVIVNTSRGPLIDEYALVDALRSKRIAGAGLDVFEHEPLPADHPFRGLDNLVATPHLGYVTQETYAVYYGDAVEAITSWLDGAPTRVLNANTA